MAWLIVACVFFSVFFVVVSLGTGIKTVSQSVRNHSGGHSDVLKLPMGGVIAATSTLFSGDIWRDAVSKSETRLIMAGNPGGKLSGAQYLAILLLASVAMFTFNFVILVIIGGVSILAFFFPLFFAICTFIIGNMWLDSVIADRKKFLEREFPYFIDMCVMVMGAGSTFSQAIKIYLGENPAGPLSAELRNVASEIDYGKSLTEALTSMESRIDSVGVSNALKAFVQGLKMGTPVIDTLDEQADAMRFMRSQIAERVGEEMKIRMQGPAMLLLVAVLILILGPAAVNLQDSGIF